MQSKIQSRFRKPDSWLMYSLTGSLKRLIKGRLSAKNRSMQIRRPTIRTKHEPGLVITLEDCSSFELKERTTYIDKQKILRKLKSKKEIENSTESIGTKWIEKTNSEETDTMKEITELVIDVTVDQINSSVLRFQLVQFLGLEFPVWISRTRNPNHAEYNLLFSQCLMNFNSSIKSKRGSKQIGKTKKVYINLLKK